VKVKLHGGPVIRPENRPGSFGSSLDRYRAGFTALNLSSGITLLVRGLSLPAGTAIVPHHAR
jgi:hypothetical protein